MHAFVPPEARLDAILARHAALEAALAETGEPSRFVAIAREIAGLADLVAATRAYRKVAGELAALDSLLVDPALEPELVEIGTAEREALRDSLHEARSALRVALLPRDGVDSRSVILEVRAGTGGDEAALFAGDLFRMYARYAELRGWTVEISSESVGTIGGYKEIIAEIRGEGAFARLKFESGVHRVQRVPDTEASGRIHTSAATVAVLPLAEEVDVAINEAELRIDTMRAGGAGGQHVNKTESAVRITHLPTGLAVVVQDERSQHKNRARAMAILRARLYALERDRLAEARASERKTQLGSGDRSERIRTYNFPQARVTDHRLNLTLYTLPAIIAGDGLDQLIEPLVTDHQARLLAGEDG